MKKALRERFASIVYRDVGMGEVAGLLIVLSEEASRGDFTPRRQDAKTPRRQDAKTQGKKLGEFLVFSLRPRFFKALIRACMPKCKSVLLVFFAFLGSLALAPLAVKFSSRYRTNALLKPANGYEVGGVTGRPMAGVLRVVANLCPNPVRRGVGVGCREAASRRCFASIVQGGGVGRQEWRRIRGGL